LHKIQENVEPGAEAVEPAMNARGSSLASSKSWLRLAVPSVGDLVFVLLLLALGCGTLARGLLGDAGIGWHIRTGELIRSAHAVPHVDPFSSVMQGKAWFAWEWLYDYVVGVLHAWFGLNGAVLLTAVLIALTFTIVFRGMMARGARLPVAIVVLLVALAASTIHFLARPHVVSWLFAVLWFRALEQFEVGGNWRRLAWLPLSMLFWVNLHGGFLVGFALLGIYFVGNLLPAWTRSTVAERAAALARARIIAIAGVVCAVITLANPYGYQLHVHIYRYLTDRFLMDHIDEFLSPNFHGLPQRAFALLVLLAVVAVVGARKKITLSQLVVVLFAIYTGLIASRNIPVSALLLAMIVAPQVSVALREIAGGGEVSEGWRQSVARFDEFSARMGAFDSGMMGRVWPALAVVGLLWVGAHQGVLGQTRAMDARFDDKRFPVKAVDYLAGSEPGGAGLPDGAVFCPDRWGGYLIYTLYPQQLVAVDDRHDLYGAEYFKRYLKIVRGEPGWREGLAETRAGWVLVPADSVLGGLLGADTGWRVVYRDDVALLFRRSG
jgi:hypothetical protein